jgi:hypothetical protein
MPGRCGQDTVAHRGQRARRSVRPRARPLPVRKHPHHQVRPSGDPGRRRGDRGRGRRTAKETDRSESESHALTATQMRMHKDLVKNGHRAFSAQSRCWRGGTAGQLAFLQPFYFIQTPNVVWMIWERDHQVRRVYLNSEHSQNPKPSWFGESVGHYENGERPQSAFSGVGAPGSSSARPGLWARPIGKTGRRFLNLSAPGRCFPLGDIL